MEVKRGYKQTEVGVIPKDWDEVLLNSVAKSGTGHTPDKKHSEYWNGDIKWVSLADSDALDDLYIEDTFAKITSQGIANSSAVLHPAGTVILSRDAGVGKSAILRTEMAVSQHFMAWRCGEQLDNHFLYYWLQVEKPEFERIANGSTIKTIGLPYFSDLKIPLPPVSEQRAIAGALSDVDALLGALDQLIAKKHDLKQAAMQQLLSGQTRLPGFHGEWAVKRLGDIAYIKTGSRNNEDKVADGQYPFFVRSENVERINSYSHDCEAILIPGEGRIGSIFHYIHGRFDVHQRVYAITQFKPEISARFVHFYLSKNFGAWAMQNTVKATVDSLRLPTFQTFEMNLPPILAEQTAIAEVLSDMDSELAALEQRRAKTRALKQGMMQELLTGRTRLV
jgi:type I restriction enzyme S subunit